MYAKITTIHFKPDQVEEATRIYRDIMIPSASKQKGFVNAFAFRSISQPETSVIISVWETEEDLRASKPPVEIIPQLEPLDEMTMAFTQDIYQMLFQIEGQ
jgi:quinol monooxygenase YgiN